MSDEPKVTVHDLLPVPDEKRGWYRTKFFLLIIGATMIALLSTSVALVLYRTSGTAPIDLSSSRYADVRDQIDSDDLTTFSSHGALDDRDLEKFEKIYDEQVKKTQVDQFGSSALDNASIGLNDIPDEAR